MGMNPEIKAQWIAALRSGEYQQGRKCLTTITAEGDKHCCLGVLCDLASKAAIGLEISTRAEHDNREGEEVELRTYDEHQGQLPGRVVVWAGLENARVFSDTDATVQNTHEYAIGWATVEPCDNCSGGSHTETVTLSSLNDEDHKTFAEIADLIEQYL